MDDPDDFVNFGTPIKRYDDGTAKRMHMKTSDKLYKNSKGETRLHGAFTGGFSAGYFNSAGSKEGFTPSTFISRKGNTGVDGSMKRPEDFMDDDDFGEFGIAPRKIAVQGSYRVEPTTANESKSYSDTLSQFLKPVHLSIGLILLKAMGWNEGKILGPSLPSTVSSKNKVYSCPSQPPESSPIDVWLSEAVQLKESSLSTNHGVGYRGISDQQVKFGSNVADKRHFSLFEAPTKAARAVTGQSFGVGVEEDEDDADIYAADDMTRYDISTEDNLSSKSSLFGWSGVSLIKEKGLDAFGESKCKLYPRKLYPPPTLPNDFIPKHQCQVPRVQQSTDNLDVLDRRKILHGKPSRWGVQNSGLQSSSTSSIVPTQNIESVDSIDTNYAHSSFKPFAANPDKQSRYEAYLRSRVDTGDEKYTPPSFLEPWERDREVTEFTRAAILYRPLSHGMSERFVHSKFQEGSRDLQDEEADVAEKELEEAAKGGLFGGLTRKMFEWHPCRLVCKRFNIPDPYPDSGIVGVVSDNFDVALHCGFGASKRHKAVKQLSQDKSKKSKFGGNSIDTFATDAAVVQGRPLADAGLPDSAETSITVPETKPSMDIFAAIFNDSSDDEVSIEEKEPDKPEVESDAAMNFNEPTNVLTGSGFRKTDDVDMKHNDGCIVNRDSIDVDHGDDVYASQPIGQNNSLSVTFVSITKVQDLVNCNTSMTAMPSQQKVKFRSKIERNSVKTCSRFVNSVPDNEFKNAEGQIPTNEPGKLNFNTSLSDGKVQTPHQDTVCKRLKDENPLLQGGSAIAKGSTIARGSDISQGSDIDRRSCTTHGLGITKGSNSIQCLDIAQGSDITQGPDNSQGSAIAQLEFTLPPQIMGGSDSDIVLSPPELPETGYGPSLPPTKPESGYEHSLPPTKPESGYGPSLPPTKPESGYGPLLPPTKPESGYGPSLPPTKPESGYGPSLPPTKSESCYGPSLPPTKRFPPHSDVYGPEIPPKKRKSLYSGRSSPVLPSTKPLLSRCSYDGALPLAKSHQANDRSVCLRPIVSSSACSGDSSGYDEPSSSKRAKSERKERKKKKYKKEKSKGYKYH